MKTLFLCISLFFACPGMASFNATYQAYAAGMNLLSADMRLSVNKNNYAITTSSQTKGILSVFLDSKNIFKTKGVIQKNQYKIDDYSMISMDNNKTEETFLSFQNKVGFIDYQTIMLWLMRLQQPSTQTMMVSDGKRDIKMTWTYEGQQLVNAPEGCLYRGMADTYSLRLKITDGKRRGWFFKRVQEGKTSPLRLYFAPIEPFGPVLIGATFDTGVLGTLDFCLEKIKND